MGSKISKRIAQKPPMIDFEKISMKKIGTEYPNIKEEIKK